MSWLSMFKRESETERKRREDEEFKAEIAEKLKDFKSTGRISTFGAVQPTTRPLDPDANGGGIDPDPTWLPTLCSTDEYQIIETDDPYSLPDADRRAFEQLYETHTQWKVEEEDKTQPEALSQEDTTAFDTVRIRRPIS